MEIRKSENYPEKRGKNFLHHSKKVLFGLVFFHISPVVLVKVVLF